ncbi:MAG: 4-hydroxybenzoate octaprenyltransferase [Methyloceanibacter sp.]|uniref:4-hydroxybenzoate octaprenyltransferase n=1 Tax=Methyloceanibacter sp. TaxID=1965321 RepID=UPI003D6C8E22
MSRRAKQSKADTIADAAPQNWVDRHAPAWLVPYLRLARADRPIGFYLLALPCFWGVGLAGLSVGAAYPDPWLLLLFAIGAIAMRAAGCTYNDIVDRDIDAKVARTRGRPLPSGQVSVAQAAIFMGLLSLIGLAVLLSLNRFAILLGLCVIPIVMLYPFVKRISHWPQAVLGLAFNWGALMGWAAVLGRLDAAPIVLYAGAVAWTIGYDTIYAHQDREDDALIGTKSTALRFGRATKTWLAGFYAFAWSAMVMTGLLAGAGLVFLIFIGVAGAQLAWQVATLDIDDADNCLARFRSNRDFGLIVFAAIATDMALASAF